MAAAVMSATPLETFTTTSTTVTARSRKRDVRRRSLPVKRRYSETYVEEEEKVEGEREGGGDKYWNSTMSYDDDDDDDCLFQLRQNKSARVANNPYLNAFFLLFEDDVVQDFLWVDSCAKVSDKYLLAMVYVYFRRARLPVEHYHRSNFFAALYLANDMEEDEDEEKYEIFPWALGEDWLHKFPSFLHQRDLLWFRMNFRAVVSRKTCEEVITMNPKHEIWQRCRWRHHGGATRSYAKPPSPRYGRTSPIYCEHCTRISALELSSGERYREDGEEEEEEIEEEGSEEIGGRYGARKVTQCFNDLLDEIDFSTGVIGSCEPFQLATAETVAPTSGMKVSRAPGDKWTLPGISWDS